MISLLVVPRILFPIPWKKARNLFVSLFSSVFNFSWGLPTVGESAQENVVLVYIVLSVVLYMTWLTISALCGSYHDVLAKEQVFIPTYRATGVGSRGKESPCDAYFLPRGYPRAPSRTKATVMQPGY